MLTHPLLFLICLLRPSSLRRAASQRLRPSQLEACAGGPSLRFPTPSKGQCRWVGKDHRGEAKAYPDDFEGLHNEVEIYQCPSRGRRVIFSNGVPDHNITLRNGAGLCECRRAIELPLRPDVRADGRRTEVPRRGMIAVALNGVPVHGAQENDDLDVVGGDDPRVRGARFWHGHMHEGRKVTWHYHNPEMGRESPSNETLLGYAMDGFPIYGPLDDDQVLDVCNGRYDEEGEYRYHVRTSKQVDGSLEYCNGDIPGTNWNYVLGCYSGSLEDARVYDARSYSLDDDCFPDDLSGATLEASDISAVSGKDTIPKRPNVIIMQPDDLPFYDAWGPPPPATPGETVQLPRYGLPHIDSLRLNGLQMMQAYTTSPMCGTSRFSTLTSRYPSRVQSNERSGDYLPTVTIPATKLVGDDCERHNLAVQFRDNGYRTAMIGKWHLSKTETSYTYGDAVNTVKKCGFNIVEGLYMENLSKNYKLETDGSFSHNMEWITHEAVKVIKEDSKEPFFMYFNPTVPHPSHSIRSALTDFSCRDTPSGTLAEEPVVPGMTDEGNCESYRASIFRRADREEDLGAIWIDDGVGALLHALEDTGKLEDTVFLFQADHGIDPKGSLYEGGVRIPQFVHYPSAIGAGMTFESPVSVLDAGATVLDYAGIAPSYDIDGRSWKEAISDKSSPTDWEARCLYFETEKDRAVRCGCLKYLRIFSRGSSSTYRRGGNMGLSNDKINLFDLCGGSEGYVTNIGRKSTEASNLILDYPSGTTSDLAALIDCHHERIGTEDFSECQLISEENPSRDVGHSVL